MGSWTFITKTGQEPTIGAIPDRPGCFAIMAFGGNGITYSRIAAEVIASQLIGRPDLDADLLAYM
jgi:glycine/D-amino acid oxidase-like deaminating enzyme